MRPSSAIAAILLISGFAYGCLAPSDSRPGPRRSPSAWSPVPTERKNAPRLSVDRRDAGFVVL